jgi:hypothetical protein
MNAANATAIRNSDNMRYTIENLLRQKTYLRET